MTRTSEYGSPFRNKDSGVDESKDKVNIQRLNLGLKNFVEQNKGLSYFLLFLFPFLSL